MGAFQRRIICEYLGWDRNATQQGALDFNPMRRAAVTQARWREYDRVIEAFDLAPECEDHRLCPEVMATMFRIDEDNALRNATHNPSRLTMPDYDNAVPVIIPVRSDAIARNSRRHGQDSQARPPERAPRLFDLSFSIAPEELFADKAAVWCETVERNTEDGGVSAHSSCQLLWFW
jgi:hypothetical protein